jgi:soluble lytic murein transglycosylase
LLEITAASDRGSDYFGNVKRKPAIIFFVFLLLAGITFYFWRAEQREKRFAQQIHAAANRYHVDFLLLQAVVWRESRFDPTVRGRKGEIGLMQLQEIAAQEWADEERIKTFQHEHCTDPGTNTLAGAFYLSKLLKRYAKTDNPVPYALADYNAGRGNVLKWTDGAAATNSEIFVRQIGFPSTKHYVETVMRRRNFYKLLARFGVDGL